MAPRPRSRAFPLVLVLGFLLLPLAGCGEDDPAPPEAPAPDGGDAEAPWSEPAAGEVAQGSPDGDEPRSAGSLVVRLRTRVREGRGMTDAGYERDVRDVAEVLWPAHGSIGERRGAQVHVQLAAIAAEVGVWLAAEDGARAARQQSDPVDVEIHDAWLAALDKGPEAYRAWCEQAGAKLLEKLAAARRAKFFPPR